MKRSMGNAEQERGRDAHIRPRHEPSGSLGAEGSSTVVQNRPVLSLSSSRMVTDESADMEQMEEGQSESDDQSDSEEHEEDSDMEGQATLEDLLKALKSRAVRIRVKALKLILSRVSGFTASDHERLIEIVQRMLYVESDKGAK
ncbi:hypothetical protein BGZ76_002251, partial [Entomortierella beljakovae]